MLIGEPPVTSADIHFNLFGFPVRVHPFFWVVSLIIGIGGFGSGAADPVETLIWVAVVFVSILVHELGHAFLQRRFGGNPWITLYAMGGLASCSDCDRSPRSQILISAAGPAAGFLLALATVLTVRLAGHQIGFVYWRTVFDNQFLLDRGLAGLSGLSMVFVKAYWEPFGSQPVNSVVSSLLWINIMWGVVNLLPIYPLDGGRISRELFTLQGNTRQGIINSLWLSAWASAAVAVYGLTERSLFMVLLFGYLAYQNYQTIQYYRQYGSNPGW